MSEHLGMPLWYHREICILWDRIHWMRIIIPFSSDWNLCLFRRMIFWSKALCRL